MFDFFEELSKPDPINERRRLNLIKKIQGQMDRDHEREENSMNDLNNFNS